MWLLVLLLILWRLLVLLLLELTLEETALLAVLLLLELTRDMLLELLLLDAWMLVLDDLALPPFASANFYHHLIKDGKGRIWWAHWFHEWGVVADGRAIIQGLTHLPTARRLYNDYVAI